jgi:hypothetical protein
MRPKRRKEVGCGVRFCETTSIGFPSLYRRGRREGRSSVRVCASGEILEIQANMTNVTKRKVTFANGCEVVFDVDTGSAGPAFFVLGVRKSGSSLLNNLCNVLSTTNGHPFIDIGGVLFEKNIPADEWGVYPGILPILNPGNTYGGFREVPPIFLDNDLFKNSAKILLVRFPHDALVSEFYSSAFSHAVPKPTAAGDAVTKTMELFRKQALTSTIDDYVVPRAHSLARQMLEYAAVARWDSTMLFKYEDWIFRKAELIKAIASHFGWKVDDQLIGHMLAWADIRPVTEDPHAFVRKVTPGDHRQKLRPDTIATLNTILRPAMEAFDYHPSN